ncbi:BadF/BadG/BcrA/BcrD ATPase family protein [Candidatus Lokiarchaeum ossiferum]|uniref:BadF/BadG/BcrA/BcrD ATPase family protein n=1 Tax=Candidatus Lokiarchaeum ossiferum TaxID=2951803 RepID=UPI00352EA248
MYIVGVDGGGTKTSVIVFRATGECCGMRTNPFSSSIDSAPIEIVHRQIEQAIIDLIPQTQEKIYLAAIFLGMGGIVSPTDAELVRSLVQSWSICTPSTIIQVKNDIYNAHAAALLGKPGICFIIGTGSVGFGINENGNEHRVGGYSFKEGDPGSAYHLGRLGLKNLAKALDKRIPFTPVLKAIQDHFNILGYIEYVNIINSISREKTAQVAKIITKYAEVGDELAIQLVDLAADEIVLMFRAIIATLNIQNQEIAIVGSLGTRNSEFKTKIFEKLAKAAPLYKIFSSKWEPVVGSAILAFRSINNENYQDYLISNSKLIQDRRK